MLLLERVSARLLMHLALALGVALMAGPVSAGESYAIAMHGQPALPAGYTHMPYANPDAPKGGHLTWGMLGTFDSLNPLIVKGLAVQQIRGFVVESLMARGNDEAFTLYGLLARSVETDESRTYVTFRLDPRARFSDGKPVLADDVLFSWALLRDHGRPNHRQYYAKVAKAEPLDPLTVRFDLSGANDRELPLILGLMPVLPRHAIDVSTFEETTMTGPIGSGPYRVSEVKPGSSVTLTRNPDYWGRDLPVNRGLWNFDEIRIDFYRELDASVRKCHVILPGTHHDHLGRATGGHAEQGPRHEQSRGLGNEIEIEQDDRRARHAFHHVHVDVFLNTNKLALDEPKFIRFILVHRSSIPLELGVLINLVDHAGRAERSVAGFSTNADMTHSARDPPEKQAPVVVVAHGDVEVKRDGARARVVIQGECLARAEIGEGVPHEFEAPVLLVSAVVVESLPVIDRAVPRTP